ncbi:MAG: hypothetical protein IME96_06835 [Proteobacteria bacterium]|nr:hypothetical protein [Pseudomonadota bacterium]
MNLKAVFLFTAMLVLSACAATKGHKMLTDYLDNGIGRITYEDVVKKWHSPDEVIDGEETITGIWIEEYFIDTRSTYSYTAPTVFGEKRTLIFDGETQLLKSYKIEYY